VNSALDRLCWRNGFDISTNYYEEVPDTGIVREYWFSVENTTASPDGVEMPVQLINGSFPGPTIIADWGDTVGKCALFKFLKQKNLYINSKLYISRIHCKTMALVFTSTGFARTGQMAWTVSQVLHNALLLRVTL
jgi:hypothetical protein